MTDSISISTALLWAAVAVTLVLGSASGIGHFVQGMQVSALTTQVNALTDEFDSLKAERDDRKADSAEKLAKMKQVKEQKKEKRQKIVQNAKSRRKENGASQKIQAFIDAYNVKEPTATELTTIVLESAERIVAINQKVKDGTIKPDAKDAKMAAEREARDNKVVALLGEPLGQTYRDELEAR